MEARSTTAPAPAAVLGAPGARVAFRAHGRPVTVDDALAALALRGTWADIVHVVAAASAALADADEELVRRIDDALAPQETALRRRLSLTAADDYRAWLERWDLDVAACRAHLRRRLAVELGGPVPADDVVTGDALRAHVVLEGLVDDAVRQLAEDAALAPSDEVEHDAWLAAVVSGAAADRGREPDVEALESLVAESTVDWTVVEATVVVTADDDVAHELLLCVHEQRGPLADVATSVGLASDDVATTLDRLPDWLEQPLLGAEPGALLGPLPHPDGRAVVEVRARRRPSTDDVAVRRRAADVLRERRAAVAMSSAVRWGDGG